METIPHELAINLESFRTAQAVADFSVYRLMVEEAYLFPRYYKAGQTVLDLACGIGRTTLLLHEMGLHVRGIDRSDVFIDVAKRRFPYLDLRAGSYDEIHEPDESFDHVLISFNGIDYAFPEAQRVRALRECVRVLKPGGTFIYSSHNVKSMHWFSPYYNRWRLGWKLRNCLKAYRSHAYVIEDGVYAFYAAPQFVIRQTAEMGLQLVESKGFRKLHVPALDLYFSPYVHYVFRKPSTTERA